jgi:polyhydroxybutyrate depolymerase
MRYAWLAVLLVACGHGDGDSAQQPTVDAAATPDGAPPIASGCITDVTAGDHTFTCGGLQVDARIPAACTTAGCGLILELHGDTGNGLLMDGHTNLRALGEQHGYIVIAPSGPPYGGGDLGSTWHASNDATLVDMVQQFASAFHVDAKKLHVTGFSRGGFVTWRLLCDHPDLFASAAPAGAGDGTDFGEQTCFTPGRTPARKLPILFMMGRSDQSVGYASMVKIRNAALTAYGTPGPDAPQILDQDTNYTHNRWSSADALIETFDHAYETVADGPFGYAEGHCIAGSTSDPYAPQYAIPCKLPNAFTWGEQVMAFFIAHPMP